MSKTETYGAPPILSAAEARDAASAYLQMLEQGDIETYPDYLHATGSEGVRLPLALGSIVFGNGQKGRTKAIRTIHTAHDDHTFEATALRTSGRVNVALRRHKRPWLIGITQLDLLSFLHDNEASGFARRDRWRRSDIYPLNANWQTDPDNPSALERAALPGFLDTSRVLVQALLDVTASEGM